jgi:hypothetical protein
MKMIYRKLKKQTHYLSLASWLAHDDWSRRMVPKLAGCRKGYDKVAKAWIDEDL